ncbi:MAG: alpha/beta fold hydrolase [Kiritimatiellae bacterium]|nr:alpha/beta fold hydrolase [Kiritimatiellia bacterium]
MTRWLRLLLCLALLLPLVGCDDDDDSPSSGALVKVEYLGDVSPATIPQLLAIAGVQLDLELKFAVGVYRIHYTTRDIDGDTIEVSGAMFVPIGAPAAPFACTQHGTQTLRHNVASTTPLIYGADALMMAAEGYVACSPDYIGYGSSTEPHPYLHAGTSAGTVLDAIRAGKRFCKRNDVELDGRLFLVGYSQGGYVTLAAQRAIEEGASVGLDLTAVASLSGAYDLVGIVDIMLANPNDDDVVLAAYFITAYNDIYGWGRLSEIFRSPYDALVTGLFDGTRSFADIRAVLAPTVGGLLDPSFVGRYLRGEEPEVRGAIAENALLDWTPRAPLRLFHGSADTTVPYINAVTALDTFNQRGAADVRLITLNGLGHEPGIEAAIEPTLAWFRSMK